MTRSRRQHSAMPSSGHLRPMPINMASHIASALAGTVKPFASHIVPDLTDSLSRTKLRQWTSYTKRMLHLTLSNQHISAPTTPSATITATPNPKSRLQSWTRRTRRPALRRGRRDSQCQSVMNISTTSLGDIQCTCLCTIHTAYPLSVVVDSMHQILAP